MMDLDAFDYLLSDFAGGADTDEYNYLDFDFSKEENITIFMNKLKFFFEKNFSTEQKIALKETLNHLISSNISIEKHMNNFLYPFDISNCQLYFFKKLRFVLYN